MSTTHLTAGFLPLLDSVLLVLAREKGFAEAEGLDLHLVRETSWANIRDRAALGHFDIAQMLAPMPLLSFLFARHAKAMFLAMDHYFDPHVKSTRGGEHSFDEDEGHERPSTR